MIQKKHCACNYDLAHVVIRMRIMGASSSAIINSTGEGDFSLWTYSDGSGDVLELLLCP